MELVGAALGGDVEDSTRTPAVFGAVGVAVHFEFAHRVGAQEISRDAGRGLLRIRLDGNPVHVKNVGGLPRAGNDQHFAAAIGGTRIVIHDAGLKRNQLRQVAAVQRQFRNLGAIDRFAQRASHRIHHGRLSGDLHGRRHGADGQLEIDDCLESHGEYDPGAAGGLEAIQAGGDFILSHVQQGGLIVSSGIAPDGSGTPCFLIDYQQGDPGQDRAGGILHRSRNSSGCNLTVRR